MYVNCMQEQKDGAKIKVRMYMTNIYEEKININRFNPIQARLSRHPKHPSTSNNDDG